MGRQWIRETSNQKFVDGGLAPFGLNFFMPILPNRRLELRHPAGRKVSKLALDAISRVGAKGFGIPDWGNYCISTA